jgi:hypothetical protein
MTTTPPSDKPAFDPATLDFIVSELETMEGLYKEKVIALARRILPNLTAEDIRNPHDFPDLVDPDWHFEDGQLSGIQAVLFLVRKLRRDQDIA